MIQLPPTIRLATPQELPKHSKSLAQLEASKQAKIIPGYTLQPSPASQNLPFTFYAEINIDNDNLWNLISALTEELPELSAMIFHHIDDKPAYGKYVKKKDILAHLKPFVNELSADPYFNWGLIFQDQERLIEVFIPAAKYLQFWGINQPNFVQIMQKFGLTQIDDLNFIDEYPKVRQPLHLFNPEAKDTTDLINLFHSLFSDQ